MFKEQFIKETSEEYSYTIYSERYNEHREVITEKYFNWLYSYIDKIIEKYK